MSKCICQKLHTVLKGYSKGGGTGGAGGHVPPPPPQKKNFQHPKSALFSKWKVPFF